VIVAVKERHPFPSCAFAQDQLSVRIGDAELGEGRLAGSARRAGHRIGWQLEYTCPDPPLLLLPERLYATGFPKAKSLVGAPNARFRGTLDVDGTAVAVDDWIGSQNHNWGERHTDRYAWGQVAGFDGAEQAFLECASARLRVGPLWTPWITPLVLRLDGREHRFNALPAALRARTRLHARCATTTRPVASRPASTPRSPAASCACGCRVRPSGCCAAARARRSSC
jgi:hypothetical protein